MSKEKVCVCAKHKLEIMQKDYNLYNNLYKMYYANKNL